MVAAPEAQQKKPGVVLGPDGKPCKTCNSGEAFKAWTMQQKKGTGAMGAAFGGLATAAASTSKPPRTDCPADVEKLGRHTWTFLHTTASFFPLAPSPAHTTSMLSLLHSLPTLYPCSHCAGELKTYVAANPPDSAVKSGRTAIEQWLCEAHNDVNARLGKSPFDCATVGERWRDGWKDGSCD